jgi:hypothetical protein
MTWDLRSRYSFDASEGQIPEGRASSYGYANAAANCVPASITAALDLAGFGDIDPQQITNDVYGANYRGGYGTFDKALDWTYAHVPGAPRWTHGPFDFGKAEQAGQSGQLIVIAGWIDAPTVTFIPGPQAWSHASLLIAHQADDSFVIWNTWQGAIQTYSRATLAASLYEMAIMEANNLQSALQAFIEIIELTGELPPSGGGEQWLTDIINQRNPDEVGSQIGELLKRPNVKAYLARQAWLRNNLDIDPATGAAFLKPGAVPAGAPGKDGAPGTPGLNAPAPTDAQVQGVVKGILVNLIGKAV